MEKRVKTPEDIGQDRQAISRGNEWINYLKTLEPSPKTLETLRKQRNLKDGADPPMVKYQLRQRVGVNTMGGEAS